MNRQMVLLGLLFGIGISMSGVAMAESPAVTRLRDAGAKMREDGGKIVDLRIDCTGLEDADYRSIGGLKSLRSISIDGKPMLDRHLEMLSGLTELEAFQLNCTQLTDDGYRHFASFKKLKRLSLFHPSRDVDAFTGAGLAHLKALPALRRLTFAGATAGDQAFKAVSELTQLEEFSQWHNKETSRAIKHLASLELKGLKMGQRLPNWGTEAPPSLDDATLIEIAKMQTLESVDLQEARLSYEGLQKLKSLPGLKKLKLKWVDISEQDVEKLRAEMPGVSIDWEPLSSEDEQNLLVKKLKL